MRRFLSTSMFIAVCAQGGLLAGCHADANDPAGQAKELEDPVRRGNAIANLTRLYTTALSVYSSAQTPDGQTQYARCEGGRFVPVANAPAAWANVVPEGAAPNGPCGREHPKVKEMDDAIQAALTKVFIEHPEDNANRRHIVNLLKELRDPRTLPALVKALDWRTEVSEDQAIAAAQTLQSMPVPDEKKAEVVEALSNALSKVEGARRQDNQMRIEFIRALGAIRSPAATTALVRMMMTRSESQSFLINILAAQQIGPIATENEIPALVQALFLFDPRNPQLRMNDVAAQALVRVGRPALAPLLALLRGENPEAKALAAQYIDAVRLRAPAAAAQMNVDTVIANEATYSLGELGLSEALEILVGETENADQGRKIGAAVALVRLEGNAEQTQRVRDAIRKVYDASPKQFRPQLIVAMRHMVDDGAMPFFLELASDKRELEVPDIRLQALRAHALLANKVEAAAARSVIDAEPNLTEEQAQADDAPVTFRPQMMEDNDAALRAAEECDTDVACWTRKLEDNDEHVVTKAVYMLARYGRGNAGAIEKLTAELGHTDPEVRMDMFYALDLMATNVGNAQVRTAVEAAIEKIAQLESAEQGRQIWNLVKGLALPTQARLRTRLSPSAG